MKYSADKVVTEGILYSLRGAGYDPVSIDYLAYEIEYDGLAILFFPPCTGRNVIRFACPRIFNGTTLDASVLLDTVNAANALVTGVKYLCLNGDVWVICEYTGWENENSYEMVLDTLKALKNGTDKFLSLIAERVDYATL